MRRLREAVLTSWRRLMLSLAMSGIILMPCERLAGQDEQSSQDIDKQHRLIEGSWTVTISPVPKGVQFTPFQALVTFTAGRKECEGTVIETEDDAFSPANGLISPGHGVWSLRVKDYAYTFIVHLYDPQGNLAAIETDSASVALGEDGKTFKGRAHFEADDTNGNPLYSGDASLTAKRIELRPL